MPKHSIHSNRNPDQLLFARAQAARDQGYISQAEASFRQSLAVRKTALGAEHPTVALSMNPLANLLSEQERDKEAEPRGGKKRSNKAWKPGRSCLWKGVRKLAPRCVAMSGAKVDISNCLPVDGREFIWRIDAQNRILFANDNWFAFARENGAPVLLPANVIGRVLGDFLCNSETKQLFEVLLAKVRETGVSAVLPFHCDSPDRRRFIEVRILVLPRQEVEFRSRIVRQELRDQVRLMAQNVGRTNEVLVMCGWCKKVRLPSEQWLEVEAAAKALSLFDAPRLPRISHGICELCVAAFDQTMKQCPRK